MQMQEGLNATPVTISHKMTPQLHRSEAVEALLDLPSVSTSGAAQGQQGVL